MFLLEFGAVSLEHTIHVCFSYFVPFEADNILRLPISFRPTLMLNPGEEAVDATLNANTVSLTVDCPDFINRVTNLGENMEQDLADGNRFILHNQQSLNIELQFHQVQNENSTTDSVMCDLSSIVPRESQLHGKVAVVIDHKINCRYTQLNQCELHFAFDASDNMNSSKIAIQHALIDVVNQLDTLVTKVKVSCFGRRIKTWGNEMGESLENWLTSTMNENFGPHPEIANCLRQIYSSANVGATCPRQVILLTNAAPLNYDDVIRAAADARATGTYNNRTFTIGVDNNVSQGLCKKIASTLDGQALFCSTNDDIASHLQSQVRRAQLKSNMKLKSFRTSLLNATDKLVGPATLNTDCGLWNDTHLDSITLFDGEGDNKMGSILTDDVTHVRTGFIFDKVPKTGFVSVKVDVTLEEIDSGKSVSTSEDLKIALVGEPNAVFYSYVYESLNRRINLRIDGLERSIIDLSKTMQVLCELTCFCYIKSTGKRPFNDRDDPTGQQVAQRPRYG